MINLRRSAVVLLLTLAAGTVPFSEPLASASVRPHQVITVTSVTSRSTTAVLRTWTWTGTRYVAVFAATIANIGVHGVGPTREGWGRTPAGVFTLSQAFGNQPNDGTRLAYFQGGIDDWWDENPASAQYNRHVHSAVSPGGASENILRAGRAYAHAVLINYNTRPVVKGAGSGFFLHVSTGYPTAGCVAVNAQEITEILRWLRPSDHPVISIGVGSAATALLSRG